ncbi:hypothetical protein BHM03_00012184 [Ensete ventricosum]|nr:hypothetical protein BHM03_00012184 [Ensete ventricosum]
MAGGGIAVEVIISSSTEPLLHSRASYVCSLSNIDDELRSFSCLWWMCVDQSNTRHTVIS